MHRFGELRKNLFVFVFVFVLAIGSIACEYRPFRSELDEGRCFVDLEYLGCSVSTVDPVQRPF